MDILMRRRDLLALGGVGLLATVASRRVEAKRPQLSAQEKANIDLVTRFLESCTAKPFDVDKLVATYFAANATVRWADNMPAAIGADAAIAAAKPLMPAGSWIEIQTFDIFACGPLVATSRLDIIKIPGKPDTTLPIAGVHVVKDGKFIEYCDYIVAA